MRRLRLLPIVLFAAGSLLVLKTAGLIVNGGYTLRGLSDAHAQDGQTRSWAQDVLGFPQSGGTPAPTVTGAIVSAGAGTKPAPGGAARSEPPPPDGRQVPVDGGPHVPPGERAVLERLQQRREELERRNRELDTREGLLKAAEQRLESRLADLKQMEARVEAAMQQQDDAETARFKGLIVMYENMKPKEAARIFDRLDLKVLVVMATRMNPRRMSDILAQMSPEAAQRLTVELAARTRSSGTPAADQLPKIEGRPRS